MTSNKSVLTFRAPNNCAKFHQNRIKGVTTDRQKDASDFIICSMLCYSSGTQKKTLLYHTNPLCMLACRLLALSSLFLSRSAMSARTVSGSISIKDARYSMHIHRCRNFHHFLTHKQTAKLQASPILTVTRVSRCQLPGLCGSTGCSGHAVTVKTR